MPATELYLTLPDGHIMDNRDLVSCCIRVSDAVSWGTADKSSGILDMLHDPAVGSIRYAINGTKYVHVYNYTYMLLYIHV